MSQNFKTEHRKNVNGKNHFEISTEFIVERNIMQNVRYSVFSAILIFVCVEISISKYNQRRQPFFFSPSLSLVSYLSLYI